MGSVAASWNNDSSMPDRHPVVRRRCTCRAIAVLRGSIHCNYKYNKIIDWSFKKQRKTHLAFPIQCRRFFFSSCCHSPLVDRKNHFFSIVHWAFRCFWKRTRFHNMEGTLIECKQKKTAKQLNMNLHELFLFHVLAERTGAKSRTVNQSLANFSLSLAKMGRQSETGIN